MINISYNLSSVLKENLKSCDSLRKNILLSPVSRKLKIKLQWDCLVERIYYSQKVSDSLIKKSEIIKILENPIEVIRKKRKKTGDEEKLTINYKRAFDNVSQNWHVNTKNVHVKDILMLYDIVGEGDLVLPRSDIESVLNYAQIQEEHPIIKAGIVYITLLELQAFSSENEKLAKIIAYLFLYKYGYDVEGLVGFEDEWAENIRAYEDARDIGVQASSKTIWLEFFSKSVAAHLEKIYKKIQDESSVFLDKETSLWKLNDRQREILRLLDKPDSSITNRKVQKYFRISQITSSRDLARLTALGLLFSHGKGRSVYYIRA